MKRTRRVLERLEPRHIGAAADRFIAAHRRSAWLRFLARGCRAYLRAYKNFNYDHAYNGESWALARLGGPSTRCIFDVGANVGDWTSAARAASPNAVIHCFEVVPETAERLRRRFAGEARVIVNPVGLSDHSGEVRLKHFPDAVNLTTIADYPRDFPHQTLIAEVTTGDEYVAKHGVEEIDFLKIDVEGAEPEVLRGFERTLAAGRVAAVQFEYGRVNILTRHLLKDFYDFFSSRGYLVGKLYPNYLDVRPYRLEDEDFVGPNFMAIRRERTDLLRSLGAG